jgi:hypothetical protein
MFTMSDEIKQPPFLLDESKRKGCLAYVDGTLTYFINRYNKQDLLWSLWHSYAKSPYYEDPSLENEFYEALTSRENWVEYSETIIIKDEDVPQRDQKYPLGYRRLSHRLDFYVTKEDCKQAFLALKPLGRKRGDGRIVDAWIFGRVRVVMLQDGQFVDGSEPNLTDRVAG